MSVFILKGMCREGRSNKYWIVGIYVDKELCEKISDKLNLLSDKEYLFCCKSYTENSLIQLKNIHKNSFPLDVVRQNTMTCFIDFESGTVRQHEYPTLYANKFQYDTYEYNIEEEKYSSSSSEEEYIH